MTRFLSLHRVGPLAALLLVGVGSALHAQTRRYSVLDIGSFSGSSFGSETFGFGVNARGQVVGWSYGEGDVGAQAFRTEPNRPINSATDDLGGLFNLGGSIESQAYGINIQGQVVGTSEGNLVGHAFRTAPNRPINPATDDLGTLGEPADDQFSSAAGINIWGQVVGASSYLGIDAQHGISVFPEHAFRTAPNRPINPATDDLGTLGGADSAANGINDWGQAVGIAYFSDDTTYHAFRTAPNRRINPATDDLGTLGGANSEADGINDWGQVVGYASTSSAEWHAFRTAPNRPINPATDDLGTLGGTVSEALSINNRGDVVGYSFTDSDNTIEHAFLSRGGVMYDLNDLIPADSGIVLEEAESINDAGQIVAIAGGRTFLLTPVRK